MDRDDRLNITEEEFLLTGCFLKLARIYDAIRELSDILYCEDEIEPMEVLVRVRYSFGCVFGD